MKVKCNKESWIAGASEIWVTRRSTWYTGRNPETNQIQLNQLGSDEYHQIKKVERDKINDLLFIDYNYYPNLDPYVWGDYYLYVIFEHDAWPVDEEEAEITLGSITWKLPYRATEENPPEETPYDTGAIYVYLLNFEQDLNCIYYASTNQF